MFKNNAALLALKAQMQAPDGRQPMGNAPVLHASAKITGRVEFLPSGVFLFTEQGERFSVALADCGKCLPGDVAQASLTPGESEVALQRLLETSHTHVIGTVRFSGDHRFINAEDRRIKQGFFIPHSGRGDEKDGDIVYAKINRHPFETGKGQAVVERVIAEASDKSAIWKLALFRMGVDRSYPEFQAKSLDPAKRADLTHLPFVTIDGESTRDMDDALFAQVRAEGGWDVFIAIADPDAYLEQGSALDLQARHRASTSYLPGMTTPMLPPELSEDSVSLMANKDRPVLIAKLVVGERGCLLSQDFELAMIRSRLRLSYQAVNDYLSGEFDLNAPREVKESLRSLYWFSKARQSWRKECALLQDRDDADYRLDVSDYQVNRIVRDPRNDAHKLVEEAMIAGNIAFAHYADEHGIQVLSRTQAGFHPKALDAVNVIAQLYGLDEFSEGESNFGKTLQLLKAVDNSGDIAHQLRIRSTFLGSMYSTDQGYHASLGLERYATFTSPIRKYSDLINHRQLKAFLLEMPLQPIDPAEVDLLNERSKSCVQGEREVARKLYARHYSFLAGEPVEGVVIGIRNRYLDVLVNGAKVSAQVRFDAPVMPRFDNDSAQLSLLVDGVERIRLGDTVKVALDVRDLERGDLKGRVHI